MNNLNFSLYVVEQKLTLPEKLIPVKNVNQITERKKITLYTKAQAYNLCNTTDITLVNVLDMSSKYILYIDNALKYRIAGGVFVQLELVSFL